MFVYKIQNKINDKIYIGITKHSVDKRISSHLKNNSYIGSALRKYGLESFSISTIDTAEDRETLSEKEKYWIKELNTKHPNGYNLTDGGDGNHTPSEEVRKNWSEKRKGKIPWNKNKKWPEEVKNKISASSKGKKLSEETKKKMSQSQTGRLTTEETKIKLSNANKGKPPSKNCVLAVIDSNKKRKWTEESRKKVSDFFKGRKRDVQLEKKPLEEGVLIYG